MSTRYCTLWRDDCGVPRLDAVDEEMVREAALVVILWGFFDGYGAEFGVAFVDVSFVVC